MLLSGRRKAPFPHQYGRLPLLMRARPSGRFQLTRACLSCVNESLPKLVQAHRRSQASLDKKGSVGRLPSPVTGRPQSEEARQLGRLQLTVRSTTTLVCIFLRPVELYWVEVGQRTLPTGHSSRATKWLHTHQHKQHTVSLVTVLFSVRDV